eukprot:scaffold193734_cov25-Prasinocladus_malaysianus.AAC.1
MARRWMPPAYFLRSFWCTTPRISAGRTSASSERSLGLRTWPSTLLRVCSEKGRGTALCPPCSWQQNMSTTAAATADKRCTVLSS